MAPSTKAPGGRRGSGRGAVYIQVLVEPPQGPERLKQLQTRLLDLKPWLTSAMQIARDAIAEEFASSSWSLPGTGTKGWRPVLPFGPNETGPMKPLVKTGAYRDAWLGQGTGAIEEMDATSFTIGVRGFPGGGIHRGGLTARAAGESGGDQVTRIRVTQKMRWFLGFAKGVWLKKSTEFITIWSRPHATPSLATREAMRDALGEYLVGVAAAAAPAERRATA